MCEDCTNVVRDTPMLAAVSSEETLDIIRNSGGSKIHSKVLYRNLVLKLCKPQAISIT